ncbi:DUF4296 domain-containing protein [Myroides marinus]|uniref:DUF4296 domain-containing protein n=1 Tax=Myroides marinus TaxID=703342 RepID=UPI00257544EE|nr:DUF4296 domain-containing protein [Myroides marinus]MDM1367761.1 DUF4296 domain-containing protein [Myroides marinus]MDM1371953.1 DUF4296 domain-containing protein [Myroides marinus]MDM1375893.1 DUF4296 domain-containing protein [Myroides marinus]MDM1382362.1 DUF4296 domain-containing protein [Myroides marinus]MDM1389673.1 DUF4296 domain-containing protein [Myroides marinus]
MNRFLVILTVLILMSCKNSTTKPTPFIEQKKMEDILYDMAVLYSIESVSAYSREDTLKKINVSAIYKKYDIDSLTFVSNNRYYVELGDGVYNKMQNNILGRLEAAKVVADSLYNKFEANKEDQKAIEDALPQLEAEKTDSVQIQKK